MEHGDVFSFGDSMQSAGETFQTNQSFLFQGKEYVSRRRLDPLSQQSARATETFKSWSYCSTRRK